ncbi:MAG: Rpn family recombination-promoting nuclease/putative transposase [Fibrobacter sp.]|nr:Rpn family recombination-promoting nuclease/putative transposase [Fibrobacter sp.]
MEHNNPDSLSEYFIKPGETSPFTDLLIDPAFKQAFDPDKPDSKINLINLLNDILGPQLHHTITDVRRRGSEQNATGSKESKTTFFDLHCTDDSGELIEIEVQIRPFTNFLKRLAFYAGQMVVSQGYPGWKYDVKPTYIMAIAQHKLFEDDRIIHRSSICDLKTGKIMMDSYNFTIIEVPKIFKEINLSTNENRWLFALKFLSQLKKLPPALQDQKFKHLTSVSQISNLKGDKLQEYLMMKNARWDNEVVLDYIEQHDSDAFKKHDEKVLKEKAKEQAKKMLADNIPINDIINYTSLTKEEIEAL